jgi:hypothetical protein
MKKLLVVLFAICIGGASSGQSFNKLDFYLATQLESIQSKKANLNLELPMLIKGNINGIKQLVKSNGGVFKYSYGNIASIEIPLRALPAFNESGAVTRMDGGPQHLRKLDDSSNINNRIIQVLDGTHPLTQAYNGKGVVMGFVDTGIDYLHPDFRDSSGTRVQYYWDQNQATNAYTPSGFGYGQAWNRLQIDSGVANDNTACTWSGHGTNVAGVAVGNAKCNGHQIGGCPQSDIIFVAYNLTVQGPSMLTDGVKYIYDCADSLHEPCVINISLGGSDGSHDDSDLQGELIDNMIAAHQPGSVLVAAIGDMDTPYHVHDSLKAGDTTFTWFLYDAGYTFVDIPIFANEPDFNSVKFRLRCDKVQDSTITERDTMTVFSNIKDFLSLNGFTVYSKNGNVLGTVNYLGQTYAHGSYSLEFQISTDSTSYYWGFEATDTGSHYGRFDIWDVGSINGVRDLAGLNINPVKYPIIKKYQQPDSIMTLCSSFQCSPHVITAQTYINGTYYVNCSPGDTTKNGLIAGAYNWYYSKGPTRNFVHMKPDISAAGNFTLSAYPLCLTSCGTNTDPLECHNIDGGTSMASPMVASAAGEYLQKYPHATDSNVRRCLIETAYSDRFTGPANTLPNYDWGYGKLDAFAALTGCGVTSVPVATAPVNGFGLTAYPNPYSINTTISYDFSSIKSFNKSSIIVYDMLGRVVKTIDLNNNKGTVNMNRANLASGIYLYSLVVDGSRVKTQKLDVL